MGVYVYDGASVFVSVYRLCVDVSVAVLITDHTATPGTDPCECVEVNPRPPNKYELLNSDRIPSNLPVFVPGIPSLLYTPLTLS